MKHILKYNAGILLLSLIATLVIALPAVADNIELRQVISGYDCAHSTFETAEGQANNINCAVFSPTIDEFNANNGQPIIRGVYDSVHSTNLSVLFNDKLYTLSEDVELVQNGNLWALDLSNSLPLVGPGSYIVVVEMTNQIGQIVSASRTFIIYPEQSEPHTPSVGPLSPTGQNSNAMVVLGLITVVASIGVLLVRKLFAEKIKND